MTAELQIEKRAAHLGVRFYRAGGVEVVLVPLLDETASFTRSAGDGYFLVVLMGEPGAAYPLDLRAPASWEPAYLERKFHLDRRGFGYSPEELAAALRAIARDLGNEEGMDA